MMNVGLNHRGVDPQLGAIPPSQSVTAALNHHIIDSFERLRRQPIEAAFERVMFGTGSQ